MYQGGGETQLLIEVERLKLALSHSNEKEDLLKKLIEQRDNEVKTLRDLLKRLTTE